MNISDHFDPEQEHGSILEAFSEFVAKFSYQYEALNREAPRSLTEAPAITQWRDTDKRKVFLGRFSHRNLQVLYEDLSTEEQRTGMTFKNLVTLFTDHFKQSTNQTLASYRFRKMVQEEKESFETFCIKIKRESKNCNFKCGDNCTIGDVMIKDQILFGTREAEIRKTALKEDWDLATLLKKGRAMEASDRGAAVIKQEPPDEVKRMKPGKYSRKSMHQHKGGSSTRRKDIPPPKHGRPQRQCKHCSDRRCEGEKSCRGKNGTCFSCGQHGHFMGAELCKKKKQYSIRSRKVDLDDSSSSGSEQEDFSDRNSTLPEDSSSDEEAARPQTESERKSKGVARVFSRLSTIRRIGGRRYPTVLRTKSRYTINVIIKERMVPVFCDTGADVCIMSKANARRLKLEVVPTAMAIRPYGSKAQKCMGETICTVMFNANVATTKFYILDAKVETLLSGAVSEELGIITMHPTGSNKEARTSRISGMKSRIMAKYPTIFQGTGTLRNYKVKFYVDEEVPPVYQPARPIPFHLRSKMDKELETMEREDVIEPHNGPAPWVSNVVMTPKDDGGLRITIDMRQANKAIKKTNLPIPRPEEISSQLSGYTVFSKLDFRSAFHQLEIDEESRALTVFHANGRLMRYKRLTMGTTPASGELNKALRPIFQDISDAHVIQDDLIIGGRTQAHHDQVLEQVCQKIEDIGMTLNPDKCIISAGEIPWWGMMISKDGVSPDRNKVDALKHMTPPRSKDEVKSLFCMLQSNRNFIPRLASKTIHIRDLLKKEADFSWTRKCQSEFDKIKTEFSEDILLRHFDPRLRTEIHVDAHRSGLSALLIQVDKRGEKHMVGVSSRATTPVETRYPQIDLESLAVDFGLRRYRFYIAGGPQVTVVTDHKPLRSIFKNLRKGSIRSERIKLRHQDIDYVVVWQEGATNAADYLSRHATPLKHMPQDVEEETMELEKTVWFMQYSPYTEAVSIAQLIDETNNDPLLRSLKKFMRKGYLPKSQKCLAPYAKVWDQLTTLDTGLIMKGEKIVLPEAMVKVAIEKAHQGGHPGMTTMKRRLRTHFWCPQLNEKVQEVVKSCKECAMFTPKNRKNPLQPHRLTEFNAWEKLSVDLFGPMPDHRHIIVAQDMVSKFPAAKILNKTDAAHVTSALREFYTAYGTPIIHRTDNGPPFNSKDFEAFSKQHAIHHETSPPYHPNANPVETIMKPMGKCMKAAHSQGKNKEKALQEWLASYRATPHSATGIAPGDVMFRHGYGSVFPKKDPVTNEQIQEAFGRDQQQREERDAELNLTRRRDNFQVGNQVILKNNGHTKFQPLYGPDPKTIVAIGEEGVTCKDAQGTLQRRHQDDVKTAPTLDCPTSQQQQPEVPATSTLEESPLEEAASRRPVRDRRPNPKYNERDFHLY